MRAIRALFLALSPVGRYGLCSPYCPLGNTGFVRPIARWAIRALFALSPVGRYGLMGGYWHKANTPPVTRGCATLHPGLCSGALSGRGWWGRSDGRDCAPGLRPGVALRYTPGCVLAPIQGAGGGDDRNPGGGRTGILGRGSKCPISNRYRRPLLPSMNNWLGANICNSFRP